MGQNTQKLPNGGLVQLHWQNKNNLDETQMVAQGGDFATGEEQHAWIESMVEKFKDQCPDGWMPLLCGPDSPYFVLAAASGTPCL